MSRLKTNQYQYPFWIFSPILCTSLWSGSLLSCLLRLSTFSLYVFSRFFQILYAILFLRTKSKDNSDAVLSELIEMGIASLSTLIFLTGSPFGTLLFESVLSLLSEGFLLICRGLSTTDGFLITAVGFWPLNVSLLSLTLRSVIDSIIKYNNTTHTQFERILSRINLTMQKKSKKHTPGRHSQQPSSTPQSENKSIAISQAWRELDIMATSLDRFQDAFRKKKQGMFQTLSRSSLEGPFGGQHISGLRKDTGQRKKIVKQYHQRHEKNPLTNSTQSLQRIRVRQPPLITYQTRQQQQLKYVLPSERSFKPTTRRYHNKQSDFLTHEQNCPNPQKTSYQSNSNRMNDLLKYSYAKHKIPKIAAKVTQIHHN